MHDFTRQARPWTINAERRGQTHWTRTRALTAEWREHFWALGLQSRLRLTAAHVEVEVVMRAPLADTGACYGSVKAAIDGLVDARVLPGDGPEVVLSITMLAPRKAGKGEPERLTLRLRPGGEP
jgi:hypothetical protein